VLAVPFRRSSAASAAEAEAALAAEAGAGGIPGGERSLPAPAPALSREAA
jgi:hypothetical protein